MEILLNVFKIDPSDMKRLALTFICLISAAAAWAECPDSVAFATAPWQITELEKGACAMYAQIPMFNSMQSVCVIKYPAKKFQTKILDRSCKDADKPSKIAKELAAKFALNGSYFNMKDRSHTVYFRIGDEVLGRTHPTEVYRVDGVLAIKDKKGKKVMIAKSDTTQYESVAGKCHSVIASGPTLMLDDQVLVPVFKGAGADGANAEAAAREQASGSKGGTQHYTSDMFYDKRHPRTAVGTDDAGNIYFLVIDGRFAGQADGASIWETARICQLLGMSDAINLDGGGSTTIWGEETGVINHPYDNKKFDHKGERKIPNLLVVH